MATETINEQSARNPVANGSNALIHLEGVTKVFLTDEVETHALSGIHLDIRTGEYVSIAGPSGCGKSTLLSILGLLDTPSGGSYSLKGTEVANLSFPDRARIRNREIGFIFQSFNLIERLNVLENVALPLTYSGLHHTKRIQRASDVLKGFHLQEREYYMPWQLSGGQTQRVAIARALVNDPSIILADEPTGNLDSRSSHIIMEELSEIHKKGNTILMVTHNPNLTTYATRVITMLDGKINTDTGATNPLKDSPTKRSLIKKRKYTKRKARK